MDKGACNECKTSTIGASFMINAASRTLSRRSSSMRCHFRDGEDVDRDRHLQTGIGADVKQFSGPHAAYFTS